MAAAVFAAALVEAALVKAASATAAFVAALAAALTAAVFAAASATAASVSAAFAVVFAYLTSEFEPLMPLWGAVWYPRHLVSLLVSMPHFEMHFELFPLFLLLLVSFAVEHL